MNTFLTAKLAIIRYIYAEKPKNTMRTHYLFALATILVAVSCSSEKTSTIAGTVSDAILQKGDITVECFAPDGSSSFLDLDGCRFSFETVQETKEGFLLVISAKDMEQIDFVVVPDAAKINVTVEEDTLYISGGKQSAELNVLQNKLLAIFDGYNAMAMAEEDEDKANALLDQAFEEQKALSKEAWDKHPIADALGMQAALIYISLGSDDEVAEFWASAPEDLKNDPSIRDIYEHVLSHSDEDECSLCTIGQDCQ